MKRKLISAVLVTVMAAGMITGCSGKNSSIKNNVKTLEKEELKVSNAQLSSPDYEFEKEYAYGDFNAHSKADAERQDGIDTFEDKDIVFQDISYDQLIQLLGQEGNSINSKHIIFKRMILGGTFGMFCVRRDDDQISPA